MKGVAPVATPEGLPVLKALETLPDPMGRKKVGPDEIDTSLLVGSWRRLVLTAPHLEPGTMDWKAYIFCVLESFHRMLRRREVFAKNSRPAGEAAGRRGMGAGPPDSAGLPEPAW